MIIDSTYFIGKETYIPNAVLQPSIGSNNISAASELLQEIEDKESELMLDVLGFSQATELYNQFEISLFKLLPFHKIFFSVLSIVTSLIKVEAPLILVVITLLTNS